jgi:hypothetical protein
VGTDVHFFLEKRTNKGPWQLEDGKKSPESDHYGSVISLEGRSYVFFGLLSGVRSYHSPIYPARGIPEGTCEFVSELWADSHECGFHSSSWLTPKELKRVLDRYFKIVKKDPEWSDTVPLDIGPFDQPWRIDYSAIDYVNKLIDWEKAENLLLGCSNKTEFRFVFWFDS